MRMLSNTEAELKKRVAYRKKACVQVTMSSIVGQTYMYDKHYMPCLKIKNKRTGKK